MTKKIRKKKFSNQKNVDQKIPTKNLSFFNIFLFLTQYFVWQKQLFQNVPNQNKFPSKPPKYFFRDTFFSNQKLKMYSFTLEN